MHFQTLNNTYQGMQLQTSPQQPNARRIYKARHYKNAFPNTQSRNATPNIAPTMQLQTSPQQLGTVPNARRIYKARHYKNAFPSTQMHRSRNAAPNIAPTTRRSSQLHNPTTRHSSQRALYRTRYTVLERRHPPRLEPATRSARCPHTSS
jgi:hypothetical protein